MILAIVASLMLTFLGFLQEELYRTEIPKDGSPPLLFSTQTNHDLQRSYISAINKAEKSILILIYSITDRKVIHALREKAEQGVDVTLICHEEISYDIEKRIGPQVKILKRFGQGLMHLKILVIDNKDCFIGSANLTNASLKMHGNLVTAFNSPALSTFVSEKALSMGLYQNAKDFKSQNFIIGGQLVEMWFLPDDAGASIRIKQLIREAKKTIKVAMFTFTRQDFAKELISASLRGVLVDVAMDNLASKGSSLNIYNLLKQSNIAILLNKGPGLLHYKFLLLDGKTLVNGSANWTKNAFNTNDDCFVVIHDLDTAAIKQMENLWRSIIADSIKIVPTFTRDLKEKQL
jgi:phosphatidylserine/phosphatidylglycerophosphate/cardiolipin synthase-like enzyme